ncbi:chromosome segregation DNA-binding protein [Thiogranum longum]|uniref:Probable chromosome-partitioning protein ParB n=1 Tax=Thiogranum longum TaxID=1537524 RepID=A0A4R1HI83_9GAMM|nr:ParB/RepB/Spo0J family partition protein [Thiogranum longum]TCK16912.1 chromosome segregation DNA-binding protein [Thiogranum longum]
MAAKKRGLGRGLDALLGTPSRGATAPAASPAPARSQPTAVTDSETDTLRTLGVELLQRGKYQPRVDMHSESLEDLADSIRQQGVVQPILVRAIGKGQYEIIAGERRWRAAQLAGLQEVPVVVRKMDDRAAIAVSLIENIQRENLNPMEEARALQRLIDEFEMTHQQAAVAVGRSRAAVSNLLRLLELGEVATAMVERGELEMGHARALLALPPRAQVDAAHQVVDRGLSVRATEKLVKKLLATGDKPPSASHARRDPDLVRLEQDLSDRVGAPVQVQPGAKGKGKLVISYSSLDELDGILEHIQ